MPEYQEAKKAETKDNSPIPEVQTNSSERQTVACPNCGASIPEGASFCAECGFNLDQPLFCPNCGAKTSPGADICAVCKAWLLEGKCKFCYADISADADFCPECGNPKKGIICPNCGKLSIFDFCSCGKPLTENALKTLELVKEDPDAKAMLDVVNQTESINSELSELDKLLKNEIKTDINNEHAPASPVRKSLFSDQQVSAIMKTGENRDTAIQQRIDDKNKAEEKARMAEEEERKRQEQQRQAKIKQDQARKDALEKQQAQSIAALNAIARKQAAKKFLSHQEARRWYLSHRFPNAKGWLCNYSCSVHMYPEGPNDCDQPALGGCDYFEEPRWGANKFGTETWVPKA